MLDISNILTQDNFTIFYAQSGSDSWQTWNKPRKCNFIWIMCIGGGGSGYGGSNSAGFNGGGGGGSAGVTRALFAANVLPDTLYVQPGIAAPTGSGGGVSGVATRSLVSISPTSSLPVNLVCASGTTAASFQAGETVVTTTAANLLNLGVFTAVAGLSSGGNTTPLTNTITCPGAQGGSSSAGAESGFSILSSSLSPRISGSISTSVNGETGIWFWKPMFGLGGAGGCGSVAGVTGSNGGDGAYGCGGGGGGSSSAGGGSGGRGGDGLVIIATF